VVEEARIQVLIADGSGQTCEELASLLSAEPAILVVGTATDGDAAISITGRIKPDVVLIDIKIPGASGVEATEVITSLLPNTAVIMLSDEGGADLLRKAMVAGARQFLLKPVVKAELLKTIQQVYQTTLARRIISGPLQGSSLPTPDTQEPRDGHIVAVFSPKGGVGCTTVATNLAAALSHDLHLRVVLMDGNLAFGDVGVFFDLPPAHSLADFQFPPEQIDAEFVQGSLSHHRASGVDILLAPPRPEMAEMITTEQLRRVLAVLKTTHDYVVVDTSSSLDERMLTILEGADRILLVFTLEITAIRDAKMFLDVAELLKFPAEKTLLVLTRAQGGQSISVRDLEQTLARTLTAEISSDTRLIVRSINQGEPVVVGDHGAQVAQDFLNLARGVVAVTRSEDAPAGPAVRKTTRTGRFRLFPR